MLVQFESMTMFVGHSTYCMSLLPPALYNAINWVKHILFMMKRIGRSLKRDKSPLLEGLFTRELTHTHSHTT